MVHSAEDGSIPVADMSALIARLEAAEEGSRQLDGAIYRALNPDYTIIYDGERRPLKDLSSWSDGKIVVWLAPSRYTASIDAAMALSGALHPEGWLQFQVQQTRTSAKQCFEGNRAFWADHDAPALALCIAALKAVQPASPIQHGYEAAGEVSPNLKAKAQGEGG